MADEISIRFTIDGDSMTGAFTQKGKTKFCGLLLRSRRAVALLMGVPKTCREAVKDGVNGDLLAAAQAVRPGVRLDVSHL